MNLEQNTMYTKYWYYFHAYGYGYWDTKFRNEDDQERKQKAEEQTEKKTDLVVVVRKSHKKAHFHKTNCEHVIMKPWRKENNKY